MMKVEKTSLSYEELIQFQVKSGCPHKEVVHSTMPVKTLDRLLPFLSGHGLQIGGYVGVTHCYLVSKLKGKATLWTVDPNIKHRNLKNPFTYAYKMVSHFKLLDNSVLITNYANEQIEIFKKTKMKFDFIILDGNHSQKQVQHEVEECTKILNLGGYLILDDIDNWEGPKNVYANLNTNNYQKIPLDRRAGLLKKIKE